MIVFTNGCFDILHAGHIDFLQRAKALGTKLVVAINSDRSVRAIKGVGRPINDESARRTVLLGLRSVDEVIVFDENTPERIIERVRPDVLVKGGDWNTSEIIGADLVKSYGGQVHSLPLKAGYSTSGIVKKINSEEKPSPGGDLAVAARRLREHIEVFTELSEKCTDSIEECGELIWDTFAAGRKVLICGNGGSAADAQHIAAEFVGRYEKERKALPAIALTTDTSALTALANDYDFERIFARQVDALARAGDLLIAISTSGNSPNVIAAAMAARRLGCKVLGMTGQNGRKLASVCDVSLMVPSDNTARVQEGHITAAHIWCEMIEDKLGE